MFSSKKKKRKNDNFFPKDHKMYIYIPSAGWSFVFPGLLRSTGFCDQKPSFSDFHAGRAYFEKSNLTCLAGFVWTTLAFFINPCQSKLVGNLKYRSQTAVLQESGWLNFPCMNSNKGKDRINIHRKLLWFVAYSPFLNPLKSKIQGDGCHVKKSI